MLNCYCFPSSSQVPNPISVRINRSVERACTGTECLWHECTGKKVPTSDCDCIYCSPPAHHRETLLSHSVEAAGGSHGAPSRVQTRFGAKAHVIHGRPRLGICQRRHSESPQSTVCGTCLEPPSRGQVLVRKSTERGQRSIMPSPPPLSTAARQAPTAPPLSSRLGALNKYTPQI